MNEIDVPVFNRRKRIHPANGENTEIEFLDAAERHFAENGYAGAKIRAIADEAKANLGALHYYWGSKESLFRSVCNRRVAPVMEMRNLRMDALGEPPHSVASILQAFFEPSFLAYRDDPSKRKIFCQTYARILTDPAPEMRTIMADIFGATTSRFVDLLRNACCHLDDATFYWRLHCVFGVFQHAASYSDKIGTLAAGRFDRADIDCGMDRIMTFVVAGLEAPA
jgi:AcrR family transcriptional regulator